MDLKTRFLSDGKEFHVEYHDADSFDALPTEKITQVYGICFCNGKLLIGRRVRNGTWGHLGGHPEKGETLEQALRREIQEESNMRVVDFLPIGYQIVDGHDGRQEFQLRYCCTVEPIDDFIRDPDLHEGGGIDAIKLIPSSEYKEYVHWGEIGDRLMERALAVFTKLGGVVIE